MTDNTPLDADRIETVDQPGGELPGNPVPDVDEPADDVDRPVQTDNRPRPEDGPQDVPQTAAPVTGDLDDDYDPDVTDADLAGGDA